MSIVLDLIKPNETSTELIKPETDFLSWREHPLNTNQTQPHLLARHTNKKYKSTIRKHSSKIVYYSTNVHSIMMPRGPECKS